MKTVYILGAGASYDSRCVLDVLSQSDPEVEIPDIPNSKYSDNDETLRHGVPLLKDFWKSLLWFDNYFSYEGNYGAYDDLLKVILRYFMNVKCSYTDELYTHKPFFEHIKTLTVDGSQNFVPDLEEILTFIDLTVNISGDSETVAFFNNARRQCIFLLCKVVMSNLDSLVSSTGTITSINYEKLCNQLSVDDTVISFNWDNLFEHSYYKTKSNGKLVINSYTTALPTQISSSTCSGCHILNNTSVNHGGYYLKLHGSLTWYRCLNNTCANYSNPLAFDITGIETPKSIVKCPHCYFDMEPVMIPPTSMKRLETSLTLAKQWRIALEELKKADRVIIIGYSFPKTDYMSLWLLRYGLFRENDSLNIIVAASDKDRDHYNSIIGEKYTFINGFTELCANNTIMV